MVNNPQDLILNRKQLQLLFGDTPIKQQAVVAFDNLFKKLTPTEYYCYLVADYPLVSAITPQKAFNVTPSGALSLNAGEYIFEWLHFLDSMSATSGNAQLGLLGAGNAVLANTEKFISIALDSAVNIIGTPSMSHNSALTTSPNPIAAASVATSLAIYSRGSFTISTGGTIIPSVTLATAAAAISKKGSFFKATVVDLNNLIGPWS